MRLPQVFAHATTAQLSCHVQIFVVIIMTPLRHMQNDILIKFDPQNPEWNVCVFIGWCGSSRLIATLQLRSGIKDLLLGIPTAGNQSQIGLDSNLKTVVWWSGLIQNLHHSRWNLSMVDPQWNMLCWWLLPHKVLRCGWLWVGDPGGGTRSGFIRGCAAPGSEPLPYFRENWTPKTYPILGKSHNPGHPKWSGLKKHTLF